MTALPRYKLSTSTDAGASVLEAARLLVPLLEKYAESNEQAGELAPEVVEALQQRNLFGYYVPRSHGGLGLNVVESIGVIEAIAYGDGPSAWVMMTSSVAAGTSLAYLGESAIAELFKGGRVPVMAGMGTPNGRAVPVEGGFRLTGRWNYGSGIKHADYVHSGAIVFEAGAPRRTTAGTPEIRRFILPREQVIFEDNWNVMGLCATGSIDYAIQDVFVPDAYCHIADTQDHGAGNLFRLGIIGLVVAGHSGFALGVGRRLLDEIAGFACGRTGKPGLLGESESFHEQYGSFEAKFHAARAFVMQAWEDVQATLDAGRDPSTRQLTLIRLALNHITWTASDIAMFAYKSAGGTALRDGVIQRFFRDMHAGTQHITSSPAILRDCGKELSGLAEGKVWGFLGLVDRA